MGNNKWHTMYGQGERRKETRNTSQVEESSETIAAGVSTTMDSPGHSRCWDKAKQGIAKMSRTFDGIERGVGWCRARRGMRLDEVQDGVE